MCNPTNQLLNKNTPITHLQHEAVAVVQAMQHLMDHSPAVVKRYGQQFRQVKGSLAASQACVAAQACSQVSMAAAAVITSNC